MAMLILHVGSSLSNWYLAANCTAIYYRGIYVVQGAINYGGVLLFHRARKSRSLVTGALTAEGSLGGM